MNERKATTFVFGPFRIDPARRLLARDGQPIALKPKEFDTLLTLVEEDGTVVDKDDLMARVWPDSYVADGSLAKNISILRKALGEDVIETHRGRGYRITLPIASISSTAQYVATPLFHQAERVGVTETLPFRFRLAVRMAPSPPPCRVESNRKSFTSCHHVR